LPVQHRSIQVEKEDLRYPSLAYITGPHDETLSRAQKGWKENANMNRAREYLKENPTVYNSVKIVKSLHEDDEVESMIEKLSTRLNKRNLNVELIVTPNKPGAASVMSQSTAHASGAGESRWLQ
jgi:hypothetical protein